jgi:hypothetical protein
MPAFVSTTSNVSVTGGTGSVKSQMFVARQANIQSLPCYIGLN